MIILLLLFQQILLGETPITQINYGALSAQQTGLRLSTFDIDVTPPMGYPVAFQIEINNRNLGLHAKGIVILGARKPIVLCAIDWVGKVSVHVTYLHDASTFTPNSEKTLLEAGLDPEGRISIRVKKMISYLATVVRKSLDYFQTTNYPGLGATAVHKAATNRDVSKGKDGKAIRTRFSSTEGDTFLRTLPIGTADSVVPAASFWNNDKPVGSREMVPQQHTFMVTMKQLTSNSDVSVSPATEDILVKAIEPY